jgi:hypothetical protein
MRKPEEEEEFARVAPLVGRDGQDLPRSDNKPLADDAKRTECAHVLTMRMKPVQASKLLPRHMAKWWACVKCGETWHWDCPPSRAGRIIRDR